MRTSKSNSDWKRWSALLGAATILGVAGCTDTNNNGQPDSAATPGQVENAADTAGQATENAVETTGEVAGNVAEGAADVATQGTINTKINAAYAADNSLSALKINVDVVEDTKTVTLKGEVTNAAQKNLAEKIAKKEAPDYKVDNQLTVKGGASPMMSNDADDKKAP